MSQLANQVSGAQLGHLALLFILWDFGKVLNSCGCHCYISGTIPVSASSQWGERQQGGGLGLVR